MPELTASPVTDSKTEALILKCYRYDCGERQLPNMYMLCEGIFRELWMERRLQLIEAAIGRHDDILYGFDTRESFIAAAFRQDFNDESVDPKIDKIPLYDTIYNVVHYYNMTYSDHRPNKQYAPVIGVW